MDSTLTPAEWDMATSLPADGQTYAIEGVAFRAKHLPMTRMKVEQVVIECRYGTLRRRLVKGKWQATEYVDTF